MLKITDTQRKQYHKSLGHIPSSSGMPTPRIGIMGVGHNVEIVNLGLYFDNTLVISDIHIGYEEALNKRGILIPRFQFKDIIKGFDKLFDELKGRKIGRIIINGDLKHEFSRISETEWRHTLRLLDYLLKKKPASLKLCTLTDKPSRRQVPVTIDYLGFTVPDKFLVGYGLDWDEKFRYLPDICVLED